MAEEISIKARDAIIKMLQIANTKAGEQIRLGRRVPLANDFEPDLPANEKYPMIVVSNTGINFFDNTETGSRAQGKRKAGFQIDCYLVQNYQVLHFYS